MVSGRNSNGWKDEKTENINTFDSVKAAIINQYGPPEVLQIAEIPIPDITADEVLVKVMAAAVNPVDWKQRQGWHKLFLKAHFPVVLGYDISGEVVKCGDRITQFKTGDKVYGRLTRRFGGAYAEYAAASGSAIALKPSNLSWEEAAAVPLASISALQSLRDKCKIKQGEKVLLIGAAGGLGHFVLQIAKSMGAEVTAVCSSRHKKMMDELSPARFIDYTATDYKSAGICYDVVYDSAGKESYRTTKHILNRGGIYLTTLPRPKLLVHKLLALFAGKRVKTFLMKSLGEDLEIISEMIKNGEMKIYIDSVFPLDQIVDAHKRAEEYQTEGKIIIKINA